MSNYRRLISYIYAYEGGEKGKNIGFAKIESRGAQCKISVNVKKVYVGSNNMGVFLLSGDREIFLGNIFIRNGTGEFRTMVLTNDVERSGSAMDQCYGLTVHEVGDTWQSYTTIWEDAVAQAAEVELKEAIPQNAAYGEGQGQAPKDGEEGKLRSLVEEIDKEVAQEEIRKEKEAGEDGAAGLAQELLKGPLESPLEEKEAGGGQREQEDGDGLEGQPCGQSGNLAYGDAGCYGRDSQGYGKTPYAYSGYGRAEAFPGASPYGDGSLVRAQKARLYQGDASGGMGNRPPYLGNWVNQGFGWRGQGGQEPREPQEEPRESQEEPSKPQEEPREPQEEPREPQEEPREPQEEPREPQPGLRPMEPSPNSGVDDGNRQEVEPSAPPVGEAQDLEHLQAKEKKAEGEEGEKIWDQLKRGHAKIQAFDYENGCEVLTIKPQDIGLLPRENWVFGNNSFLLHGYYNYRYLILARLSNPEGPPRYLLGVPGHYFSNEKYMASMFGFPSFVLSKKQPVKDGRFGYWYTDVKLGG